MVAKVEHGGIFVPRRVRGVKDMRRLFLGRELPESRGIRDIDNVARSFDPLARRDPSTVVRRRRQRPCDQVIPLVLLYGSR